MTTTSKPRAARRARKRKPAPTPAPALAPTPALALAPTPAPVPAPTSYFKDARNRMRIHDYEIQELRKDAVNVYEYMIGLYKRVIT